MFRVIIVSCMIGALTGCAEQAGRTCPPGYGPPVTVFTLFLGKSIPGREDLTDREWLDFLDATITTNLPNGYTVLDADGGWMNPITHKSIKEATKVLLVALPAVPSSLAAINRIRTAYQVRFRQQLVGMTVEDACGAF